MSIHLSISVPKPSRISVANELADVVKKSVMQVKRDWDAGIPIHSTLMGDGGFNLGADAFKKVVALLEAHGIQPQAYWTSFDPSDDPESLVGNEITVEYAINSIDERLAEMRKSGLYGL